MSTILPQEMAIDLLANGQTVTDTAKAIEVTGRRCVSDCTIIPAFRWYRDPAGGVPGRGAWHAAAEPRHGHAACRRLWPRGGACKITTVFRDTSNTYTGRAYSYIVAGSRFAQSRPIWYTAALASVGS